MNHIARLQTDLSAARAEITAKSEIIQAFRVHLSGNKFFGTDPDGSRRDWIAVGSTRPQSGTSCAVTGSCPLRPTVSAGTPVLHRLHLRQR